MGYVLADTWVADSVVLLAMIIGLIYYYSISTFKYWEKRNVKSLNNPKPFFGNMLEMITMTKYFGHVMQDMYKESEGMKCVGYYKFREPALLIRDPGLIKLVVLKDFSHFTDNDIHASEDSDPMLALNVFSMKGDKWKYARSKVSPIFSTGKIRHMFPLILDVCNELKANIERKIQSGDPEFDAKNLAANFTTDVVASCAFGIKCNSLLDENNEFRLMGKKIMTPTKLRSLLTTISFFWPSLSSVLGFFGIQFFTSNILDFFRGLVKNAMEFREKNNVKRNDLIQLLMQLKKEGKVEQDPEEKSTMNGSNEANVSSTAKFELSDDFLTAQAVGFFFDGFETSSIALSMAMHELAMNQDVQSKLREEIKKTLKEHNGELNYEAVRECSYLDMVFLETLRKYPAVGGLSKTCTKRYEIPDLNILVEPGTTVTIPVQGLHYDPQYYPEPDAFKPERFADNRKNIVPFTFMSFGDGPRQCIGMRFAMAQVKAALATTILNFQLKPSPKTKHPVTLDPSFFMVYVIGGVNIQAEPLQE